MRYKADIIVKLKNGIRDPQGSAIETILKRTQIDDEPKITVGKFFSIEIEGNSKESAMLKLDRIAQDVLSNSVLEKYEITRFEAL